MRRRMRSPLIALLSVGPVVFQACPGAGLIQGYFENCFDEDTISSSEYDDLNIFEQLLYTENDCDRYEPRL